jgi:hypothetical protein
VRLLHSALNPLELLRSVEQRRHHPAGAAEDVWEECCDESEMNAVDACACFWLDIGKEISGSVCVCVCVCVCICTRRHSLPFVVLVPCTNDHR